MKKILLACDTGIVTSTIAGKKLEEALNEKGFTGQYEIHKCKVAEVPDKSAHADLCVTMTPIRGEVRCPVIMGAPALLTGIGVEPVIGRAIEVLNE